MKKSIHSLIIVLAACITNLAAQESHSHPHDAPSTEHAEGADDVFAVYAESDKYELTLKHKELAPGKEGDLTLYIADFKTNQPLDSIRLNITVQEDKNIAVEVNRAEPGIYHLHANFPEAKGYTLLTNIDSRERGPDLLMLAKVEVGKALPGAAETEEHAHEDSDWWKFILVFAAGLGIGYIFLRRRSKVAVSILLIIILHAAIQNINAHGGHGDEEGKAGNEVYIPKETQFLFNVYTQQLKPGSFQPSIEFFGTVVPSPGGYASITAPQGGKITSLRVTPGQKVNAGQVVAVMLPSASLSERVGVAAETGRLQTDVKLAQSELNAAKAELDRLNAIADIVAKKELQAAQARYNAAKANYDALRGVASGSVISSGGSITLTAPVSGTVSQFALAPGAEIMGGTTLFSITNLDKVYVEAQVYDRDADVVRNASNYTVTCTNDEHTTAQVRLISAAQEVNPTNQSQKVLFEVLNPGDDFKLGEFVTLHAYQEGVSNTMFVTNSALSEINGKPVIFIKESPEMYSVRYISAGDDNGTHTVILKGLNESERFVVEGTYQVKMMMLNQ